MNDIHLRNTTVKKIETAYPKEWLKLCCGITEHLSKHGNTQGSAKINKVWSVDQIEKVVLFKLTHANKNTNEDEQVPTFDFIFQLKDCRVVTGKLQDVMPCTCCWIWEGSVTVTSE